MAQVYKATAWWQYTMIRITLALVLGLLMGRYIPIPQWCLWLCFIPVFLVWLFIDQRNTQDLFHMRWISGGAIQVIFIMIGYVLLYRQPIPRIQSTITLIERPIQKANHYEAKAMMGETILLIYFQANHQIKDLTIGARLRLYKQPSAILNNSNPGGFNYQAYAASQNIYHQVYLKATDFALLSISNPPIFQSYLTQTSAYVLRVLTQYIHQPRERSVAEALLIGYKKNLDKVLMNAYSNTGVIHIIAISGLHLGMIYTLLLWMFSPLNQFKKIQWLKRGLILLLLWGFTLLTGAGASVLRAAVMFSFLILGEQQQRPIQVMNTLAASAFCLLIYHPLFLWDIGFQLSYAAVFGIVLFAKPIEKIIFIKNKLLQYCWQLTCVTIAAQLLTLPLLLYYFNSFPNLFLLTNFIAVPLSGIILYLCIALLVFSPISFMGVAIGKITTWLLTQLNQFIEQSASIPFAITNHIQISLTQTMVIYICVIAYAIWIAKKKVPLFWIGNLALLLYVGLRCVDIIKRQQQQKIVVYHVPQYAAIDLIEGLSHRYIGHPTINQNHLRQLQFLTPTRTLYRASKQANRLQMHSSPPFIISANKLILWIYPQSRIPPFHRVPKIDILLVSGGVKPPFNALALHSPNIVMVFDSSNPLWKIQLWKKEAERLHLRHHSVPEQGAFEYNL
jgi:competence protein ComEC